MRFILFVEGHSDRLTLPGFLKRWLDPRLTEPVRITAVRHDGWREYYKDIRTKVHLHLEGPRSGDIIAAIGLLDLYGPTFYPSHLKSADERYVWGRQHIEDQVGHGKFRQFFAVHELEAWLLADPSLFLPEVSRALPGKAAQPEAVNFDLPPAKLLRKLYSEKANSEYRKVTDGTELFGHLDPALAREKCPRLREMLDGMLALAKAVGL